MTVETLPRAAAAPARAHHPSFAQVALGLAGRNLRLVRRRPSVFIPSLVMPLFILVATAGAFRGIGALPQLAGQAYLAFTVPLAAVMGAGFAGVNSGMNLARDLEGGFFDRLAASPASRLALITGPLIAAILRSVVDFYERGGDANPNLDPLMVPLYLSERDKEDLVAFMHALTGSNVQDLVQQARAAASTPSPPVD